MSTGLTAQPQGGFQPHGIFSARTIAIASWIPVTVAAGIAEWGTPNLYIYVSTLWWVGIVMQLLAGYLRFLRKGV